MKHPSMLAALPAQLLTCVRLVFDANEDGEEPTLSEALTMATGAAAGAGSITIELTEADKAAIERLPDLGIERDACTEAYLSCDLEPNLILDNVLN